MASHDTAAAHLSPLQSAFRDTMASVCTPVAVVTTTTDEGPHGTTVSAFASLSMDPPMVLVSLDRSSQLLAAVRRTGCFGVNVLTAEQSDLATRFAGKGGTDKFADVRWEPEAGIPRIAGAGGFLSCTVSRLVDAGDHVIALGDVMFAATDTHRPLTYHQRVFGTHHADLGQAAG